MQLTTVRATNQPGGTHTRVPACATMWATWLPQIGLEPKGLMRERDSILAGKAKEGPATPNSPILAWRSSAPTRSAAPYVCWTCARTCRT
eukprot:9773752-Alexandrium_andersonii.AAC.1